MAEHLYLLTLLQGAVMYVCMYTEEKLRRNEVKDTLTCSQYIILGSCAPWVVVSIINGSHIKNNPLFLHPEACCIRVYLVKESISLSIRTKTFIAQCFYHNRYVHI